MHSTLVVDDIDIYVDGAGSESIVMIHGWPDTWRLWDAQVDYFKSLYRCVRFTLPGFDIKKKKRAYSLDELMEIFKHIIEQSCPRQRVILMLHDWGCVFGYQFSLRYPDLVSKVIGVDVGDAPSPQYTLSLNFPQKCTILAYQLWLAAAWKIGGKLGNLMTKIMARILKLARNRDNQFISSSMNYPYYIQHTDTYGSYKGMREYIPECPLLFIYGTRKPFLFHSPQWVQSLSQRKDCQVTAFGAGHWLSVEESERFNQTTLQWLTKSAGCVSQKEQ